MTIRGVMSTPPPRRRAAQQPQVFNNLLLNTLGTLRGPFHKKDWPNPVRANGRLQPQPAENLLLTRLSVVVASKPFNQFDWPNPIRSQVSLARHYMEAARYVAVVEPTPSIPVDYQNPRIARKVQQPTVLPNLTLGTLYVPPSVIPLRPFDWQNPTRRRWHGQPAQVIQNLVLGAVFPDPFRKSDWPNPVRGRRVQQPELRLIQPVFVVDATPDQFTFVDQLSVATSAEITSDPVTISGINVAADITVTGGTYSVNGSAFTALPGTVFNGDSIRARHTSSASAGSVTNTVIDIEGISDTFSSTTVTDAVERIVLGVSMVRNIRIRVDRSS